MTQIWEMTASEIAGSVRSGTLSAQEVTQAHLDRIAAVNPAINAVVQTCTDALDAAAEVDAALARGEDPGPMAGVPVTIKVNVDQKGFANTNGLRIQENLIAEHDSPVVSNLRKAGAVIVGRTNTPAFSLRWFTNNGLHGQTLNPRNPAITPGGSSGGASASVAAGLCAMGHGTDIAGSIRYPAYACGLHGLRPTFGRVPAYNASAADRMIGAQIMAVSGPITRSIDDIALSLRAMSAPDARDPWHVPASLDGPAFAKRVALCLAPDDMPVSEPVRLALRDAADRLRNAGWEVEETDCPSMRKAAAVNARLWMADTQTGARDLIEREDDPDAKFVFARMCEDAGEVGLKDLMEALQTRVGLIRDWELFLARYPVLLCPVSGEQAFDQQLDVSSEANFARVFEAQLPQRAIPTLGLPSLAVATGQSGGRPLGVQLTAARFREDILIAAGHAIEAAGPPPKVSTPDWRA
jgi:amidase